MLLCESGCESLHWAPCVCECCSPPKRWWMPLSTFSKMAAMAGVGVAATQALQGSGRRRKTREAEGGRGKGRRERRRQR